MAELREPSDSIEIYPNPTTSQISIRSGGTLILGIRVLNVLGEQVLNISDQNSSDLSFDLSKLSQGTYFLEIETIRGTVLKKVIRK